MTNGVLVFVIPELSGGGAARVASILTRHWTDIGYEVHLVTFETAGTTPAYKLSSKIILHQISKPHSQPGLSFAFTNFSRIASVRKIIRKARPHAVIAFLLEANVVSLIASAGLRIPVIISERNHPAFHKISLLKQVIRSLSYRYAARLCVQTAEIRDWFRNHLGVDSAVIANPVDPPNVASSIEPRPRNRIVSLGRLEPQKAYADLINAFASIQNFAPQWNLTIFGEGSERRNLERLLDTLDLRGRVLLPGTTSDPARELGTAELFVLPSAYEGYPNALLEALANGLCVIATDCPGASSEILGQGQYGVIVPPNDVQALASAMLQVITNTALRSKYAQRAHHAVSHLAPRAIALQWLREIDSCREKTSYRR